MTRTKLFSVAALAIMVMSAAVMFNSALTEAAGPRDCDTNAVTYCGAYSVGEMIKKINEGDTKHTAANLQHIYYNEGRGITEAGINRTCAGVVYRNGDVYVDGAPGNSICPAQRTLVARNAYTTGRTKTAGSVQSGSLWSRPAGNNWAVGVESIDAMVNMDGNKFNWAILKACGNTVTATPLVLSTPKPATPVPSTPVPATPVPATPIPATPVPATPRPIVIIVTPNTPTPTPTPTPKPATPTPEPCSTLAPAATPVSGAATPAPSNQCPTPTPTPTPTPKPATPTPTPTPIPAVLGATTGKVLGATTALPQTGPESALGGGMGLTGIGLAIRYYRKSKGDLLSALRGK